MIVRRDFWRRFRSALCEALPVPLHHTPSASLTAACAVVRCARRGQGEFTVNATGFTELTPLLDKYQGAYKCVPARHCCVHCSCMCACCVLAHVCVFGCAPAFCASPHYPSPAPPPSDERSIAGCIGLISALKIFKFLSISKKMNTLWLTLSRAAPDLLAFLVG
jgi:hypothetical protein